MKKPLHTDVVIPRQLEDTIYHISFPPEFRAEKTHTARIINNITEYTEGMQHSSIVDLSNVKSISREGRKYVQDGTGIETLPNAVAFLVKNPISRMIGNFFMGFNRPLYPVRLFGDHQRALIWVREIEDRFKAKAKVEREEKEEIMVAG